MPTAPLTKINSFVENLAEKQVNLAGSGLTIALTNTAHNAAWDELADLTQISYTNLSSRVLTVSASSQTSGTYKLVINDITLTSTGGVTGPFQYLYIFDDDSTGDKLVGYYDYGSPLTLQDGEGLVVNFDASNGVLTIT